MSKSKKHRRPKNKKKNPKQLPKEMIPEVEKDITKVLGLIDEISKIDFWSDDSDKVADQIIEKAKNVESDIKTKYKNHLDEDELNARIPKDYKDYLDTKK